VSPREYAGQSALSATAANIANSLRNTPDMAAIFRQALPYLAARTGFNGEGQCVAGVTGANLKARIEEIMKNRMALKLNFGKKAILAVAGIAALALPIAVGVINTPMMRAQSVGAHPIFICYT
jgi:hypothetical protein